MFTTSLSLAQQRKNKQKLSTNLTYRKRMQTTGPALGGQKLKGRKNSTFFKERIQLSLSLGKEDFKHKFKQNNEKAEKYSTNEGTN